MNIGFDAKRAYQNSTGLGHYSRTLIASLAKFFPEHEYYLFAPRITDKFNVAGMENIHPVPPSGFPAAMFKSAWRSSWMKKDLKEYRIDLYHGLSHEIPLNISKTGIRSVVTIHDLIFERYPEQYKKVDVLIYRKKFRYACANADRIIAISRQTKQDIIDYYQIPEEKISVCYQSCNPAFSEMVSEGKKLAVKQKYRLPDRFYLYVGSVIERKNLLLICRALKQLENNIPLVVIGDGDAYLQIVKAYIDAHGLQQRVIFLSEQPEAKSPEFRSAADFPAIYQQAIAMIYPSIFEGFGIPILEAQYSRLPVITTNLSCLPETGGNAALYVDGYDEKELAAAMTELQTNESVRKEMIEKGAVHAATFDPRICAETVMDVYNGLF